MPETLPDPTIDPARALAALRARNRYNAVLKLVRWVHLFAGLFLTPWILLYGVTGFLFNHPEAFPDREARTVGRETAAGTPMEGFPTAPKLAERIVETLNAQAGRQGFRLADRDGATYSRTLFVNAAGRGREHLVRFDPETAETFIRSTSPTKEVFAPWSSGKSLPLADSPRERLARGVPALLAKLGIEADEVTIRNPPDLVCTVEEGGRLWQVHYNLQTGVLLARPVGAPGEGLSTRRFFTGLHLSFTYPSRLDTRWFWAVAIDLLCVAMVFWGASGLLMWWQLKKLRGWGAATLALSLAVASAMAIGMHAVLASRV
jgi:hypothetical protein